MSCEARICQSRGLAHLPARVTAATARPSIMTSFIGDPKTPQIRGISLKRPPARGPSDSVWREEVNFKTHNRTFAKLRRWQDRPSVSCLIYAPPAEWVGVSLRFPVSVNLTLVITMWWTCDRDKNYGTKIPHFCLVIVCRHFFWQYYVIWKSLHSLSFQPWHLWNIVMMRTAQLLTSLYSCKNEMCKCLKRNPNACSVCGELTHFDLSASILLVWPKAMSPSPDFVVALLKSAFICYLSDLLRHCHLWLPFSMLSCKW